MTHYTTNYTSSLFALNTARRARRREYQRSAIAAASTKRDSADLAGIALDMALAEIWQDHADLAGIIPSYSSDLGVAVG